MYSITPDYCFSYPEVILKQRKLLVLRTANPLCRVLPRQTGFSTTRTHSTSESTLRSAVRSTLYRNMSASLPHFTHAIDSDFNIPVIPLQLVDALDAWNY